VPLIAPEGIYGYRAYGGFYPHLIADSAEFGFTVTSPIGGGAHGWNLYGWLGEGDENLSGAGNVPGQFGLKGNYPNPFNATTKIEFALPVSSDVRLDVYNLRGQLVETLVDRNMEPGEHSITWDASSYSSGVYFYKLTAGGDVSTGRMTLLK
jgi:hypothetical protein